MNSDFEFDSLIKKMAASHQPELPSPGLIWWRAQILKKQVEKERAERPFAIMRLLAAAVSLIVIVGLWAGQSESIRAVFGRLMVLPFGPLLFAGAAVGLAVMALMWWTTSEA
ncbi:MAG: hypothetical protein ACHP79_07800 [Terriglobales bacterium]